MIPENPSYELQSAVPIAISESSGAVTHSTCTLHCRGPDHVITDIPESEETPTPPLLNKDNSDNARTEILVEDTDRMASEAESVGLRHSVRERHQPLKFTYELGEPLILAISSFFQALGTAISHIPAPFESGVHAETHAYIYKNQ